MTSPMANHKRPERVKKIATIQRGGSATTPTSVSGGVAKRGGHARNLSDVHMLDSQAQITPRSPTSKDLNPIQMIAQRVQHQR